MGHEQRVGESKPRRLAVELRNSRTKRAWMEDERLELIVRAALEIEHGVREDLGKDDILID